MEADDGNQTESEHPTERSGCSNQTELELSVTGLISTKIALPVFKPIRL